MEYPKINNWPMNICLAVSIIAVCITIFALVNLFKSPNTIKRSGITFEETDLEQLKIIKDYDNKNIVYLYTSKVDGVAIAISHME